MSKRLISFKIVAMSFLLLLILWVVRYGINITPLKNLPPFKDIWLIVVVGVIATIIALMSLFIEIKLTSPVTFIGWILYFPTLFNILIPMFIQFFSIIGIFYSPWLLFTDIPFLYKLMYGFIVAPGLDATINYFGYLLIGIGLLIYVLGLFQILLHTTRSHSLLTKGLYSSVRHPQYLGISMWTLGFSILGWRLISYMMWLTLLYSYILLAEYEEVDLIKTFDEEYVEYRKRVPFMVPHFLQILKPFNFFELNIRLRILMYTILYIILLLTLFYMLEPNLVMFW